MDCIVYKAVAQRIQKNIDSKSVYYTSGNVLQNIDPGHEEIVL